MQEEYYFNNTFTCNICNTGKMACRDAFSPRLYKPRRIYAKYQNIVEKNNFTYQAIFITSFPYQISYKKNGELHIPSSIRRFSLSGLSMLL